ncbi:MAG: hypothetical protein CMF74_04525 [Maricaulis sp.]|jgi:hypothetical protein|nr:hypothetical protein [Maricaulis sp.]HAQ36551.1 hypothetical protein [Alphaproteobacteria bacterium]|tara:strand:+ start:762 stop:1376 length:615 start_codon:yes stop_codon:yes gene_type:complete
MGAVLTTLLALQQSVSLGLGQPCAEIQTRGLTGVVSEISSLGTSRDFDRADYRLASNGSTVCADQPAFAFSDFTPNDDQSESPVRFSTFSRFHRPNDGTGQSSSLGFAVELNNESVQFPSMAIVAGLDRRTVFVAPSLDGFQRPVVNMSNSLDVADGYGGVAWRLTPERFVSVSYVRQERSFNAGMNEWREQDHFVGFVFNQRW